MFMHVVEPWNAANRAFRCKIFQPLRPVKSLRLTWGVLYRQEYCHQDRNIEKKRDWAERSLLHNDALWGWRLSKYQFTHHTLHIHSMSTLIARHIPVTRRPRNKMDHLKFKFLFSHLSSHRCSDLRTHPSILTVRSKRSSFASARMNFHLAYWVFIVCEAFE